MRKYTLPLAAAISVLVVPLSPAHAADDYRAPLAEAVDSLAVRAEGGRDGYSRSKFPHWKDADSNGCDTRREVLIAEATEPVKVGSGCKLNGGTWWSYYDDITVSDSSKFDVDHVVPLAEAYDSGADQWSQDRRERYANDLGESRALVAVSAKSNRAKADRDVAEWLPPSEGALCQYVTDWVTVKVRWGLAADKDEADVLRKMAGGPCARQEVQTTVVGS